MFTTIDDFYNKMGKKREEEEKKGEFVLHQ